MIPESDTAGNFTDEYIFFGGKRIARRNVSSGNVYYFFADHLGSSRVVLQSGQSSPCYDADFGPFGGEHIVTNTCPQNYKFTGKERDAESGLDDFEARYYSSQFGRFHSADWSAIPVPVPYADLGNPQTLNLYAYVKNNPMNLTDPTGHLATGQLGSPEGLNVAFREIPGGGVGACDEFSCTPGALITSWELTVNGEGTGIYFTSEAQGRATADALNQQAQPQNQNVRATTIANETYATRNEAAMAAGKKALALTRKANESGTTDWEYGGWIVKDSKGRFTYTVPLRGSKRGEADIDNVKVPGGFKKVAGYHTHPDNGPWGEGLSLRDVNWANRKLTPLYVGMVYSGNVRVYVPRVTEWKGFGEITGDLVGTINH